VGESRRPDHRYKATVDRDRTRADGAKHGTTDNTAIKAAICRTDQPKIGDRKNPFPEIFPLPR
jgi:hypothetical protein